jgi:hypothetical protein
MKILIVGSNYSWSIENYFIKYFLEMGLEIELFPAQNLFYEYYYSSLMTKLLYKFHLSKIESSINYLFINQIQNYQPTHIFIFKGMEIKPASLKYAKQQGIKLVNYTKTFINTASPCHLVPSHSIPLDLCAPVSLCSYVSPLANVPTC